MQACRKLGKSVERVKERFERESVFSEQENTSREYSLTA